MTAALLLARAGHRVAIFEHSAKLGGLWASRLDPDGFFRGDNSCKVYQRGYHTAPALFRLIGTDWREHFVPRYDLTTDWLRQFTADSSWRDLAILAGAWSKSRLGLGEYHRISVLEFMTTQRLSEPCQAWMRATALGGIAGTLQMTMWEFFHRLGSNMSAILQWESCPLYWNARPPNAPGGFVALWQAALEERGVAVHTQTTITAISTDEDRVRLEDGEGSMHEADAVFLAIPPPALGRLLAASPDRITEGLGQSSSSMRAYLQESRYEHLGISWFFDRALPTDLPLGGHNVRRGWFPILVQHDQYRAWLRPPAVSVVVGSVALDTAFRHHRLGSLACEHTPETLAAILWEDERLVDPTLPEPIDVEITGLSSATQIVQRGPLPIAVEGANIFLATNLHGQAPYFTASLESAIQAGAIAARRFEPAIESLPMGPRSARPLPWSVPDRAEPGNAPRRGTSHATP